MSSLPAGVPDREGSKIEFQGERMIVPDRPVIPFIEGDGTGRDIWRASKRVFDAAVQAAYGGGRKICWLELLAGEKALKATGEVLPQSTLDAIRTYSVAIKGPLTTPVGGGFRSINVTTRQALELYACIRPVRYFQGVPSPMKHPEKLNVVIFRENMEDVYSGIEWAQGTTEAAKVISFLNSSLGTKIRTDSGIGIKPLSIFGSKRLIRKAIRFAIQNHRNIVTLVHKGNIMKYTEGAFRDWGYELAREEFPTQTITEEDVKAHHGGKIPDGKIMINDRICDSMFQQLLLRPDEYQVLATPNLNGDYLSDACAAQVGGLGMAPGANIGDRAAVFEATHGTAPKYADKDVINPGSVILSGVMMLEHMGWIEAAQLITSGIEKTIAAKRVTYDLERLMEGATKVKTSEFGSAIIENMK